MFQYKPIIENKQTNGSMLKAKSETWQKICDQMNMHAEVTQRSVKQIKQLYENMKRTAKKDNANDKLERYRTGGGKYTPQITEESTKILAMLNDHIQPDENPFDCDAEYIGETEILNDNNEIIAQEIVLPIINEAPNYEDSLPEIVELQNEAEATHAQSTITPTPTSKRRKTSTVAAECK
ncbi:hypothetical protein ANN_04019 [Periplaneta americana]|uniref:Regulatory protein zeste n=1 Tax=Periplaneta americana TaxID=6978 RepID=A0ABQ8T855_PERAM|nr:hypothetical protein ANN_04019 [Periplaneta americana]